MEGRVFSYQLNHPFNLFISGSLYYSHPSETINSR